MWKAQVAELVDAIDSKSIDGNIMRVRFSPWAPERVFHISICIISYMRYTVCYEKRTDRAAKDWVFY